MNHEQVSERGVSLQPKYRIIIIIIIIITTEVIFDVLDLPLKINFFGPSNSIRDNSPFDQLTRFILLKHHIHQTSPVTKVDQNTNLSISRFLEKQGRIKPLSHG